METNSKNLPKHFKPDDVIKGNQGEEIVAHVLRKEKYFVTCLSDINEQGRGGAPGMRNDTNYLTLPDLQVALRGKLGYCEVKWKSDYTFHRITQTPEHGVDKMCWDHYQSVKEQTGADVFLFIYERKTGAVLYNHTDHLKKVLRYSPKMGRGGMCFFKRVSFYLWGKVVQMDNRYYEQLPLFSPKIEGEGDRLFGVVVTDKRLNK